MPEQWQYTRLLAMRDLNYQIVGDGVYIQGRRVGDVAYLASLDTKTMIAYVQQELRREEQVRKVADFEAVERAANADGDRVGEFLLEIAPQVIESRNLWWVLGKIGKTLGYTDMESNDAFKMAVMLKFNTYKAANSRNDIARQIRPKLGDTNSAIDSD